MIFLHFNISGLIRRRIKCEFSKVFNRKYSTVEILIQTFLIKNKSFDLFILILLFRVFYFANIKYDTNFKFHIVNSEYSNIVNNEKTSIN